MTRKELKSLGIELNSDQIFASYEAEKFWRSASSGQVFEISGAAGTGKTTTIKYILTKLGLDVMREVLFVAFTGKAATQLARQGLPARTAHSAFYEYKKLPVRDDDNHLVWLPNGKIQTRGQFVKKEFLPGRYKAICIDESPMIDLPMKTDILSFGLPVFALGDMNQLPPVFGNPVFMINPDVTLHKLMRTAEDDPIVRIAHWILEDEPLKYGIYGKSAIIRRQDLNEKQLRSADTILTVTNQLRYQINDLFRDDYLNYKRLDFPHLGEKVICRRNNWSKSIGDNIYLTNGLTGTIDYIDKSSYNGKKVTIDFKPDFTNKSFKNLSADYKTLMRITAPDKDTYKIGLDQFEFAYAITVYSSQGSQWDNVISLAELYGSRDFQKKVLYTMVTRASRSQTLVL